MVTDMQDFLAQLKAVAEPTRLRLLAICARGELSVSEITEVVGQSQPRVSRHLKLLCDAGLLDRFREQHWVLYRIAERGRGARVARQLVAMLPKDSDALVNDRQRMDRVLGERARLVSRIMASGPQQLAAVAELEKHRGRLDQAILDILGGRAPGEVLDIGTGSGHMLAMLADRATHAVGIDISRDMLLVARNNLRAAGIGHVSVRQGDMYQLRFAPASFDTVTMDLVLSHAEQPERVILEARRVLRPGGAMLVVDFTDAAAGIAEDQLAGWLEAARMAQHARSDITLGGHKLGIWLAEAETGEEQAAA